MIPQNFPEKAVWYGIVSTYMAAPALIQWRADADRFSERLGSLVVCIGGFCILRKAFGLLQRVLPFPE